MVMIFATRWLGDRRMAHAVLSANAIETQGCLTFMVGAAEQAGFDDLCVMRASDGKQISRIMLKTVSEGPESADHGM